MRKAYGTHLTINLGKLIPQSVYADAAKQEKREATEVAYVLIDAVGREIIRFGTQAAPPTHAGLKVGRRFVGGNVITKARQYLAK